MGAMLPSRVPLTPWGCEGVEKGCTHPRPGTAEAHTGCLIHSGTSPRSVGRQVCRWVWDPALALDEPSGSQCFPVTRGLWKAEILRHSSKAGTPASVCTHAPPYHRSPPPVVSFCPASSSLPPSPHLWAESLHLVFSDYHLGDDDKDRGALGRRRERKKCTSTSL